MFISRQYTMGSMLACPMRAQCVPAQCCPEKAAGLSGIGARLVGESGSSPWAPEVPGLKTESPVRGTQLAVLAVAKNLQCDPAVRSAEKVWLDPGFFCISPHDTSIWSAVSKSIFFDKMLLPVIKHLAAIP